MVCQNCEERGDGVSFAFQKTVIFAFKCGDFCIQVMNVVFKMTNSVCCNQVHAEKLHRCEGGRRRCIRKLMDFALKLMDFALKLMDFALTLMDFVLNMMDFLLNTMDFGRLSRRRRLWQMCSLRCV